jgi:hypothetical protein
MHRLLFLLIPVGFLVSCDSSSESLLKTPQEGAKETPPAAPAIAISTEMPKETASSAPASDLGAGIEKASGGALGNVVNATQTDVPDLSAAVSFSLSADKFKELIGSYDAAQLKDIAAKLVTAVKKTKSGGQLVQDLQTKLGLVVDKLKENGVDVSQYMAFLGG